MKKRFDSVADAKKTLRKSHLTQDELVTALETIALEDRTELDAYTMFDLLKSHPQHAAVIAKFMHNRQRAEIAKQPAVRKHPLLRKVFAGEIERETKKAQPAPKDEKRTGPFRK